MDDDKKKPEENKQKKWYSMQGNSIWRYIIIFIILWLAFAYVFNFLGNKKSIDLSYSKFKSQVKADNVKEVTVKGQEINGLFKNKYSYKPESAKETTYYTAFSTVIPSYNDPELSKLLDSKDVVVNAKKQDNSSLLYLLVMVLPWLLIMGYFIYARNKMQDQMGGGSMGGIFGIGKSIQGKVKVLLQHPT